MRDEYGWESAQALMDAKVQFRRFMLVNGFGRDVVAIAFERKPESSPRVTVAAPRSQYPRGHLQELSAALGEEQWERIETATEKFDQKLVGEGKVARDGPNGIIAVCTHGWTTVFEASDPNFAIDGVLGQPKLRTDVENACAQGLAMPTAFELARMAYDLLPECHGLDRRTPRNPASSLALCKKLGGDRAAAAAAVETLQDLERQINGKGEPSFDRFFRYGEGVKAADFSKRVSGSRFDWDAPNAIDQRHVTVHGAIEPRENASTDGNTYRYANFVLQLEGENDYWRIVSYEFSELKTGKYADD